MSGISEKDIVTFAVFELEIQLTRFLELGTRLAKLNPLCSILLINALMKMIMHKDISIREICLFEKSLILLYYH